MSSFSTETYFRSPHPGIILKGELEIRGLSQRELASELGKSAPVVNGILNGSKDITVEIAILLEAALDNGLSAQEWLRLQNEYDIETKRADILVKQRIDAIAIWNFLREYANLNILKKRLNFGTDIESNVRLIMSTLGITTIKELRKKLCDTNSAFKKSEKVQTDPANVFTWAVIVKDASRKQILDTSFNIECVDELIAKLNNAFRRNTSVVETTKKLLNLYGIKFITEEKRLDKVPVDGYSFWIGNNPTIVATQRMNRIDNFAFTIMHELGHIVLHLKADSNIDYIDVENSIMPESTKEEQANEYASNALWGGENPEQYFKQIQNPYAASNDIKVIARKYKMNPAIAAGQYRHFCAEQNIVNNPYALCHELIEKIN